MQYITGLHALNLPCNLDTCGDWHQSAIQWEHPKMSESDGSLYGEYGLEPGHCIPGHEGRFVVANTLRALLDLLYEGNFSLAQGANEDFICNDKYDIEFFNQVYLMRDFCKWSEIDAFMSKEYRTKWLKFKKMKGD